MPPRLIVEVVGDVSGLERSLKQSSAQAQKFSGHMKGVSREVEGSLRGVLSVSGAFEHLGRSLAFASGGFVATAGIGEFLKGSVDAAREAEVAQKSLAAQLKASGQSFAASKEAIDKAGLSIEKFGFTTDDSAAALTVLERATGNISKAISLQGITADLARAKNLDLAAAAGIVGKAMSGQATALRRAVPGLDANAKGMDLIREAGRKLAGQAAANTTEAQKFSATLHDTEVIIGEALLPTVDKYLGELAKWLDKMNRSGKLQRDVNKAVRDGEDAFGAIKAVVTPLAKTFEAVGKAVGGTKHEVELLATAFATFKVANIVGGLSGAAGVAGAARTAEGEVGKLRVGLLSLGSPGVLAAIAAAGAASFELGTTLGNALSGRTGNGPFPLSSPTATVDGPQVNLSFPQGDPRAKRSISFDTSTGLFSEFAKGAKGQFTQTKISLDQAARDIGVSTKKLLEAIGGPRNPTKSVAAAIEAIASEASAATVIPKLTAQQAVDAFLAPLLRLQKEIAAKLPPELSKGQTLKLALAQNPDDLTALRQQAANDRAAIAFATKRLGEHKLTTKKFTATVGGYYNDLNATLARINEITSAAAAKAAEAAAKGKAAAKKAEAAALEAIRTQLRGALQKPIGGTFTDVPLSDSLARAGITDALKKGLGGTFTDARLSASRGIAAALRKGIGDSFQLLAASFDVPAKILLAEAKADATGDKTGFRNALKDARSAARKALNSGKLSIDAQIDAWDTIKNINDQLTGQITGDQTKFKHVSASTLLKGLGLTAAQIRELKPVLATIGAGGTVPALRTPAFALAHGSAGTTVNIQNFHSSAVDVAALESELVKRSQRRSHIRRGT